MQLLLKAAEASATDGDGGGFKVCLAAVPPSPSHPPTPLESVKADNFLQKPFPFQGSPSRSRPHSSQFIVPSARRRKLDCVSLVCCAQVDAKFRGQKCHAIDQCFALLQY